MFYCASTISENSSAATFAVCNLTRAIGLSKSEVSEFATVFEGKTERGMCLGIEINDRKTRHYDVYNSHYALKQIIVNRVITRILNRFILIRLVGSVKSNLYV